jgi:hypothetical protein
MQSDFGPLPPAFNGESFFAFGAAGGYPPPEHFAISFVNLPGFGTNPARRSGREIFSAKLRRLP